MKPRPPSPVAIDLTAVRQRLASAGGPAYWRSLDEVAQTAEFRDFLHREFPAHASEWLQGFSRRSFLKLMGASLALAGLTACTKQPIEKIVPYVKQPEELVLGQPLFFATAMTMGGFATGLLVESHEGHPTKVEGNPQHPMSLGATNVFHQAALLDLYDPDRSRAVLNGGHISSWEAFLSVLSDTMQLRRSKGGRGLHILTETVSSPTLHALLQALLERHPEAQWHQFEPVTRDHVRTGAQLAFGDFLETQYHFDQAKTILALESDFLYAHPASLRHARQFVERRRMTGADRQMSRFYAVESTPAVTGTNADHRLPLASRAVEELARAVAEELGALPRAGGVRGPALEAHREWIVALTEDLRQNRGASVVIAGESQPPGVHALVHRLNHFLGNAGRTVTFTRSAEARPENHVASLQRLVDALQGDQVDMLVVVGGNPAFSAPADLEFAQHLAKAKLRVHLSPEVNETSALCQWHIPQNHFLESWGDARAYDGTTSIQQPLILPLYAGKSAVELLDAMLQLPGRTDYETVRAYWQAREQWPDFDRGWRRSLHDGYIAGTAFAAQETSLPDRAVPSRSEAVTESLEITFRPDPNIWDGCFANNGWLQELAKPLTKLTWDNAALISAALAQREQLANGDMVELELADRTVRLPVWITPGQAENSIALWMGYGRTVVGRAGAGAGFDVYPLRTTGALWAGAGVKLIKTGERYPLATTQTHHVIESEERQIFREGTLAEFQANPDFVQASVKPPKPEETLFDPEEHRYDGYHWGMIIDLTACIGCNACVLACQAENNIPVVGKAQVAAGREMQWIRVDTYFKGGLENPETNHQPVPCMHCENAPCELVCPVAATVHDQEGLNLQVYNRCIGTRYCSNNCPYKVRRFNFLQYADYQTPILKPMRNPDVTVRWRGVMEKCTYCIQRISAARIEAKVEGRTIRDGEVRTACQQVCPAEAIVFGDLHDPESRASKWRASPLNFGMLSQLNTRPRTTYLAKLRNPHPRL